MPKSSQSEIHEISNAKLTFALWYVRHKVLFFRILIGLLIGLSVIFYSYTVFKIFEFVYYRRGETEQVIQNISTSSADFSFIHTRLQPQAPEILSIKTVSEDATQSDIVVEVRNPNANFVIKKLSYALVFGNVALAEGNTFIWPDTRKLIFIFNVPARSAREAPEFIIRDISWKRESHFSEVLQKRENFLISDPSYETVSQDTGTTAVVSFSVSNQTIYNFYDPGFYVVLFDGAEIVGSGYVSTHKLYSLGKADFRANFINPPFSVTSVKIISEVNILDDNAYFVEELEKKEQPKKAK